MIVNWFKTHSCIPFWCYFSLRDFGYRPIVLNVRYMQRHSMTFRKCHQHFSGWPVRSGWFVMFRWWPHVCPFPIECSISIRKMDWHADIQTAIAYRIMVLVCVHDMQMARNDRITDAVIIISERARWLVRTALLKMQAIIRRLGISADSPHSHHRSKTPSNVAECCIGRLSYFYRHGGFVICVAATLHLPQTYIL